MTSSELKTPVNIESLETEFDGLIKEVNKRVKNDVLKSHAIDQVFNNEYNYLFADRQEEKKLIIEHLTKSI